MADDSKKASKDGGKKRLDYTQLRVLTDADAEKTEQLCNELEDLMRRVKREYELWFYGTHPKPPHEMRNKLDTHVRLLRHKLPKRTADQFKIGTILFHYQTLVELWDKSVRKQEEAGTAPWMAVNRQNPLDALQDANEQRAEEAAKPVKSSYLARITSPEGSEDEMRKVFNSYVAAKKKVGEDVGGADFDKFSQALTKQAKGLIDSGKAKAVAYRVEIQDGKVSIKAKAEQD